MPNKVYILRKAFTLLELLLVIAVIASLAGVILSALNPAARLQSASDTKSVAKSNELKKAIQAYTLDNSGSLPPNILSLSTYGIYDVYKQGQSTNCVNLDVLVTNGYLSEIPTDSEGASSVISGYKIEYDPSKTTVNTYSTDALTSYVQNGATLTKGLVGYWKMDENTGTTTADSSGNNNTGTLTNGPTWTSGRYASAVNFDGTNDYIGINKDFNFDTNNQLTFSIWVKFNSLTGWQTMIGQDTNSYSGFAAFYFQKALNNTPGCGRTANTVGFVIATGNGGCDFVGAYSNTVMTTGNWYQVTATYDASTIRLYVNGNLENTFTTNASIAPQIGNLAIGSGYFSDILVDMVNGSLDDLRIYNRALSSAEITALYNYAPPAVAQWKFDEGTGTTASDSSGNINNGTLTNGPTWTGGKYGNALNFDGTNDYIALPATSNFDLQNLTISAWVYSSNFQRNMFIFEKTTNGNVNTQYSCFFEGNNIIFRTNGSSSSTINSITAGMINGQWNHVICTYNGATKRIYVNGSQKLTENYSATLVTNPAGTSFIGSFAHGGGYPTGGYFFEGKIDDIRIYNYGMTDIQIQRVMNNEI